MSSSDRAAAIALYQALSFTSSRNVELAVNKLHDAIERRDRALFFAEASREMLDEASREIMNAANNLKAAVHDAAIRTVHDHLESAIDALHQKNRQLQREYAMITPEFAEDMRRCIEQIEERLNRVDEICDEFSKN